MVTKKKVNRFTVSLPQRLPDELDERRVAKGYDSRSELVRDLIRERMIADRWEAGRSDVVGVLTILYDHHQPDLARRIMEAQHGSRVGVLCTTHVHLDAHHCLETIIIRGRPRGIQRLASEIRGLRGVLSCGLTRAARV